MQNRSLENRLLQQSAEKDLEFVPGIRFREDKTIPLTPVFRQSTSSIYTKKYVIRPEDVAEKMPRYRNVPAILTIGQTGCGSAHAKPPYGAGTITRSAHTPREHG